MRATSQKVNRVLVIDVGGTHVKVMATGQREEGRIPSGSKMTAAKMVRNVTRLAKGWQYDCVSIGYPGPVIHGNPVHEPYNLGGGWVGFVVLGGGNAKHIKDLPPDTRMGDNRNAFVGGSRLWEKKTKPRPG